MTTTASFLSKLSPTSSCWWLTPRVHIFGQTLGNAEPLQDHIDRAGELVECALGDQMIALNTLLTLALEAAAAGDETNALRELSAAVVLIKAEADRLEWEATQARILEG